jgi:hypothetical protein
MLQGDEGRKMIWDGVSEECDDNNATAIAQFHSLSGGALSRAGEQ